MTASPDDMRQAVAGYVEEIHRSYVAQALTFPPGVQGRMSLLAGTGAGRAPRELTAVAVGVRHLHLLATDTVVYHVTASPGTGLSAHAAAHVGTGLANGHSAVARDFETIRSRARGREQLVDEMAGAAAAGLIRAQALLAKAIAPRDSAVTAIADEVGRGARPDVDAVRKALLASVGGREQWRPAS